MSGKDYYFDDEEKRVYSVPSVTANLHLAWKPLVTKKHELQLYGNLKYTGKKRIFSSNLQHFYIADRTLVDAGASYTIMKGVKLSLDVENIFNTDSYIDGPTVQMFPYFQRPRTLMSSVSFTL